MKSARYYFGLIVTVIFLVTLAVEMLRESNRDTRRNEPGQERSPDAEKAPAATGDYPHLALGNPSGATEDPADKNNYLMRKPQFALAYNNGTGTPDWVSWRLTREDLGDAPRGQFYPDSGLPRGFLRVTPADYSGSGFDRGHMCPHSDRDATPAASQATFAMTNIIPQSPALNQKPWAALEEYCRELVQQRGKMLYIICGPTGRGGTGSAGPRTTIGRERRVIVPASCWKVIMVLDAGFGGEPAQVGRNTRLIAVIMPNTMDAAGGWARWRVPVGEVETLTGYRFFDRVPAPIIEPLKGKVDAVRITASADGGSRRAD